MKKYFLLFLISGFSKIGFSQDNNFYNAYFEGNSLLVKGQYDKAIEKYSAALKSFSADYVYYNRGNAYNGKKDFTNAMLDYSKTISMNPNNADAYYQRGVLKLSSNDNTGCDDLKKAVKMETPDAKETFKKLCK